MSTNSNRTIYVGMIRENLQSPRNSCSTEEQKDPVIARSEMDWSIQVPTNNIAA